HSDLGCYLSVPFIFLSSAFNQAGQSERLLPQWLTGIVAVCSFLLLTFIAALVKKVWCESSRPGERSEPQQNSGIRTSSEELKNKMTPTLVRVQRGKIHLVIDSNVGDPADRNLSRGLKAL
uniref:Uncharacterized protein n=1 Tax=Poecilia latipinna TaxID=48699 RepID=A0A3B3UEY8_9TELE